MKKAYIIMAHKNPAQLCRLVSGLNDRASEFFIHIDRTAAFAPFQIVKQLGNMVHFVKRVNSKWGSFGLVQAALNGLKAVQNSPETFDRIILLSSQDYPIKNNRYIDTFLQNSPHSVFISYSPIPNLEKWLGTDRGGLYRVDKYYFGTKRYQFFCSRSINFLTSYLPFLSRKIPDGMKSFIGSQWWIIDNYALDYILDYDAKHPEYKAFHQHTFAVDELYFQMILLNSTDEKLRQSIQNNEKRFTIWENANSSHPRLLVENDFEAIRSSDELFARKFDENAAILDMIDREILFAS